MRIYRPKYKSKGKIKQVETWSLEFKDPNGIVQRWSLGTTDKDVADITAYQVGSLNEWAKKGLDPKPDIVQWVRQQGPKFRDKIYEAGLLSPDKMNLTKPILEHLEDYQNALSINSKQCSPKITRIRKIIDSCEFEFWYDVDGEKINKYIAERYESSERFGRHTGQVYIKNFRQFANWLEKKGRINHKPIIETVKFERKERRTFENDEWQRLLEAVQEAPERSKMTGWTRYVLYNLAFETGLRVNELSSLTPVSFSFTNRTVFVSARDTKNGKEALQAITPETTLLIKDLVKDMMPTTKLFSLNIHASEFLRKDCEDAGIETTNHRGTIVFHSLRHYTATYLVSEGIDVKTVQEVMRHAKVETTLQYYTHVRTGAIRNAISTFRKKSNAKQQTA